MDSQTLYRSKLVTIPEAIGKIKSHQTVGVGMAASEPPGLLAELGNHRDRLDDVHVWVCLPLGSYSFVLDPSMEGHFFIENWFYGAADRKVHAQGRESYIPNNLHQASTRKLYANKNKVNVFIGTATPPDSRGYMSLSLGIVLERQLIDAADVVIGVLGIAAVAVQALGLGDDGNLVSHVETGHKRDIVCLGLEHDELVLGAGRRFPFDEFDVLGVGNNHLLPDMADDLIGEDDDGVPVMVRKIKRLVRQLKELLGGGRAEHQALVVTVPAAASTEPVIGLRGGDPAEPGAGPGHAYDHGGQLSRRQR